MKRPDNQAREATRATLQTCSSGSNDVVLNSQTAEPDGNR